MNRLDYITNLRFPLIAGVVLYHACCLMPAGVGGVQTVSNICVPVFFIISGYLFFLGVDCFGKSLYVQKLRSRIRTLLVPYVLWTLIYLLYTMLINLPEAIQTQNFDSVLEPLTWRIFWMYKERLPLHFSLWYLRDLMLMCVMSPIVWFLISRLKHFAMLGIWLLFLTHNIDSTISLPISIFYFSLGSYLAICRIDIQSISQKLGWAILIIAAIAIVFSLEKYIMLARFSNTLLALCCLGFSCFVTNKYQCKVPAVLTDSVFFVYATHTIQVLIAAGSISAVLIPDTACSALLFLRLLMVSLLTLAACVTLFVFFRHFFPKTLSVLTGSRYKS